MSLKPTVSPTAALNLCRFQNTTLCQEISVSLDAGYSHQNQLRQGSYIPYSSQEPFFIFQKAAAVLPLPSYSGNSSIYQYTPF